MQAARSGLNRPSWCSGHICGTEKASVLCLKPKSNVPNSQVGPRHAYVQARVCTPEQYKCKNANKKSGGWGLLKVSTVCSKLRFESQIHNTTGKPTSKNSFCDFRLRCSEDFGEKVSLLYLHFHYVWTDIPWLYVCRQESMSPYGIIPASITDF